MPGQRSVVDVSIPHEVDGWSCLLSEGNHCSAGRGREARPGIELPLRAGRGGEEERSGEGPQIRCGAVQEASKDTVFLRSRSGTWKRARMQGASGGGRQDWHGPQQPGIAGTGGPSSQSTSAFRRRPPGKRQAVKPSSKPSSRRPPPTTEYVSIAPGLQVNNAQATWCGRGAGEIPLRRARRRTSAPPTTDHWPPGQPWRRWVGEWVSGQRGW